MSEPSVPNKYKAPILSLRTRYIKDFSFENPNAPKSLRIAQKDVSVEVITDVEMLNLGNFNYMHPAILHVCIARIHEGSQTHAHTQIFFKKYI